MHMLHSSEAERRRSRLEAWGLYDTGDVTALLSKCGKAKLLKESDKRKLRDRARVEFGSCLSEDAATLLLQSGEKVACARLGSSRHEVYFSADVALFVSHEARDRSGKELIPTPAALWRCPHLLRQVVVHGPVQKNLLRGADLFTPGIVGYSELDDGTGQMSREWASSLCGGPFAKGELAAVTVAGEWAPFAVGRFVKSDRDMVEEGARGLAISVCLRIGDVVCGDAHPPAQLPVALLAALNRTSAHLREVLEGEQQIALDRSKAEAAIAAACDALELRKDKRRLEKALRSIAELSAKPGPLNEDQREKLARGPAIAAQLAVVEAKLSETASLQQEKDDEGDEREGASDGANPDALSPHEGREHDASSALDDAEATSVHEEDDDHESEDVDGHFRDAFLTVLSASHLPKKNNRKCTPRLLAEVFAETAKLAGTSIKETRWKKANRFIADEFHDGAFVTRERSPGVTELVEVDWSLAPHFEPILPTPSEGDAIAKTVFKKASKRGGKVVITVRRVRNKNCTFIDGLDAWGYSETDMRAIASAFRSRFSAAASVAPRKGTEGSSSGRQFWSIMVQGKYAEQVAATLRADLAVTDVSISAPSGLLTKQVRTANV